MAKIKALKFPVTYEAPCLGTELYGLADSGAFVPIGKIIKIHKRAEICSTDKDRHIMLKELGKTIFTAEQMQEYETIKRLTNRR